MKHLQLTFFPTRQTFICREMTTPDFGLASENTFIIPVHEDVHDGDYEQLIPQAKAMLSITPEYGGRNTIRLYDIINDEYPTEIASEELFRRNTSQTIPDYIANILNQRMAEIAQNNEPADNPTLILKLKKEINNLKTQNESLNEKISQITKILKE